MKSSANFRLRNFARERSHKIWLLMNAHRWIGASRAIALPSSLKLPPLLKLWRDETTGQAGQARSIKSLTASIGFRRGCNRTASPSPQGHGASRKLPPSNIRILFSDHSDCYT